ncbi:hypothetical protein F5X99DRAFT_212986 [Biscogniauxia marginata]|nr:hypothetical protein F5X99DRAFT_212986 [Biscogniauxia marginata]
MTSSGQSQGQNSNSNSPNGGDSSNRGSHSPPAAPAPHAKRTRVLLSCGPCRNSKLKCDRATPCGQCLKKGKPATCVYAPKPERAKPAKSMAARLRRLEGMVREMIDTTDGSSGSPGGGPAAAAAGADAGGSVVLSERATNYVGGTHFMAILEDLEDLKNYFEDPREEEEKPSDSLYDNTGPSELMMFPKGAPRSKEEMLALLPEKNVIDRLMNRYFNSNSPAQHIIHIPTFTKQYNAFLKNPQGTDLHWLALLFMVLALGILFSTFQAPHELENDSPIPAIDRFKQYRGVCGWALIRGKYYQPGPYTLQAFLLYNEGEFIFNRVSQMNCYLLSATLIRVMLKMGLHRDPSRLPNLTPYEGEMRRRMWNLAIQIDLLVSFHLGLPCMIHGIESDTAMPRNLVDADFGEDSAALPPPRPSADYTPLTYPIYKASLARVFGLVARQAHALTRPAYAEVMRVDARVGEVWAGVPAFMKVRPLDECVTDPPTLLVQRFGLASLYQKSRCVLHRRYLVEAEPRGGEHEYSRRTCLEAALALLDYQHTMIESGRPGGMLSEKAWFAYSLAINDFLLADMIVALAIQNGIYSEVGGGGGGGGDSDETTQRTPLPTKAELVRTLRRSYLMWLDVAKKIPECRKSTEVVGTMLRRIQARTGIDAGAGEVTADTDNNNNNNNSGAPTTTTTAHASDEASSMASLTIDASMGGPSSAESSSNGPSAQDFAGFGATEPNFVSVGDGALDDDDDYRRMVLDPWDDMQNGYDWSQFDAMTRGPEDVIQTIPQVSTTSSSSSQPAAWLDGIAIGDGDGSAMDDFSDFLAANSWGLAPPPP